MIAEYKIKNINFKNINSDVEIMENFSRKLRNIKLGEPENIEPNYCYNYALKNNGLDCVECGVEYLEDNYDLVKFKDVRPGDVVLFNEVYTVYHREETENHRTALHFAQVIKKGDSIGETIIRAKFGGLGIYEHKLNFTPDIYGNRVEFWHKRVRN
jgi:hypothetical protein